MVSYYDGILIAIPIAFLSGVAIQPFIGVSGIAIGGIIAMLLVTHAMFVRAPTVNRPNANDGLRDSLPDSETPSMKNTAD